MGRDRCQTAVSFKVLMLTSQLALIDFGFSVIHPIGKIHHSQIVISATVLHRQDSSTFIAEELCSERALVLCLDHMQYFVGSIRSESAEIQQISFLLALKLEAQRCGPANVPVGVLHFGRACVLLIDVAQTRLAFSGLLVTFVLRYRIIFVLINLTHVDLGFYDLLINEDLFCKLLVTLSHFC